jgi:hypothetical protein
MRASKGPVSADREAAGSRRVCLAAGAVCLSLLAGSWSACTSVASHSDDDTAAGLEQRLRADIGFLADDKLEGRGTPSRGLDLAALYLASQLSAAGVPPAAGESYLQRYSLGEYTPAEADVTVRVNGRLIAPGDYVLWNVAYDPGRGPISLPMVYAGDGIVAEDKGVDDLSALDLAGKAVVAKKGAPWPLEAAEVFGADRAMGKLIGATVRGAGMLVYLSDELDDPSREGQGDEAEAQFFHEMKNAGVCFLREPAVKHASALNPVLVLRPGVFAQAMGKGIDQLEPGPLEAGVEVLIQAKIREGAAANVLGKIEGTDPALRDEWVVLSAHYDHIGQHEVPAGNDGIWNGADDNASGTAAVLELARRLARNPGKRSVLVFFTSGEDRGILGSAYYAAQPPVPMDRVAAQINLDMIGRSEGKVQVIADGSPALYEQAVRIGQSHAIEVIPDQQPTWRIVYLTDAYHFARAGVPYAFFFTGTHPDYHQPSDTADKIRYEELTRIVGIAADLTRTYADGGPRPPFERPRWFVTP